MRVALVSTDGIHIDEHFGKAETFLIYDVSGSDVVKIAERKSVPLSIGDPDHSFDPERFDRVVQPILDCRKVAMTQIGEVPKEKLREKGIEPVVFQGSIADFLNTLKH
jgi:predicted Fe-Mo cluster-binding NifX family protein